MTIFSPLHFLTEQFGDSFSNLSITEILKISLVECQLKSIKIIFDRRLYANVKNLRIRFHTQMSQFYTPWISAILDAKRAMVEIA